MSDLTNKTVASTYKDLLHVSNSNDGVEEDIVQLHDGAGLPLPVTISKNSIGLGISGPGQYTETTESVDISATDINIESGEDIFVSAAESLSLIGQVMLSGAKVDTVAFAALDDGGVHVVQHCGHVLPETTTSYDLGAATRRYGSAYVDRVVHGVETVLFTNDGTGEALCVTTDVLVTEIDEGDLKPGSAVGTIELPAGAPGQEKIIVLPSGTYNTNNVTIDTESGPSAIITINTNETTKKVIHLVRLSGANDWIQIN